MLCAHCAPEPTPSPSQEGSNTGWPVPLLGGVRGGFVGARFMARERRNQSSALFILSFILARISIFYPLPSSER